MIFRMVSEIGNTVKWPSCKIENVMKKPWDYGVPKTTWHG